MTRTAANDNAPFANHIRFVVEPRLVPAGKAARRLHLALPEFETKRPALHASGFPKPCEITGHYDLRAIDVWQDQRSGLTSALVTASSTADLVAARLAAIV